MSALRACAIPLGVTVCMSALVRARAHAHACAHYFARYLTVTVKIRILGSIVAFALAGSLKEYKDSLLNKSSI